ncbi:recombination protein NinB [Variovorax paradoxus]|nr:recombination protein NinB [Variovorax paradoxus]MBT2300389.1 recombination protein NinB [Variovorax paradoxus]
MTERRTFRLVNNNVRQRAIDHIWGSPDGHVVTVQEPTRNLEQNAKFHAICSDLAKSKAEWMGKPRTAEQWKVLLVSGHAMATKEGAEIVPGLEGEFVNLRESTALMSKARSSSLIEYAMAYAAELEVA